MTRLRAATAFTVVVIRGLLRDRTALFFMLVLPVVIIVIIGTTFGGTERLDIGVVRLDEGPVTERLFSDLHHSSGLRAHDYGSVEEARRAVRRFVVAAAVVIEPGTENGLTGGRGTTELGFIANPASQTALTARLSVEGILARQSAEIGAARIVGAELGGTFSQDLSAATDLADVRATRLTISDVGGGRARKLSRFALVAPQELVLFVFINSMASAVLIVQARRSGVVRRALATPTSMATVIVGMGLGWFAVALLQSVVILVVGSLLFGVNWGDPIGATALVLAFALVGCGAGMLVGAVGRNEDRVSALTPIVGLVLAALGGCMVPYEVFPPAMAAVAHAVPHYWAVRGWQRLIFDGVGLSGVASSLAVLVAFAMALLAAATVRLRRELVGG